MNKIKYGSFIVISYGLALDQKYDRTMSQKMESCVENRGWLCHGFSLGLVRQLLCYTQGLNE